MIKKMRFLLMTLVMIFTLSFAGCQSTGGPEEAEFTDDLEPLDEEELAMLEDEEGFDDEMTPISEEEMEAADGDMSGGSDAYENVGTVEVEEDGTYTSKDEVAAYIYEFGRLPSNYITKKEAQKLGWNSKEGNLEEVAPGKSIGGDHFGNYDKMLPEENGRTYKECDIDFDGGYRNGKRIIYSNDGLIFYTGDHYETFEQVY